MTHVIPRSLVALTFALLLLAAPVQAQEQTEEMPPEVPAWVETFGKQLAESLDSDNDAMKKQALQHIAYFANFYEGELDLSDAIPSLVELYRNDDDADVRLFAVVALHAIGGREGMRQVRRSLPAQQWPMPLQFVSLAALISHYGAEEMAVDPQTVRLAEELLEMYVRPRVEVGPLEVVPVPTEPGR